MTTQEESETKVAARLEPHGREKMLIEFCCEVMHDAYERAAVAEGWETNTTSRVPWNDVPPANQATMRTAMRALLDELGLHLEIRGY